MAYDALNTLTATSGEVGAAAMRQTVTGDTAVNTAGRYVGANRDFTVEFLVATAPTGDGSPTLDVKLQDSVDGVTFADMAGYGFTQITAVMTAKQRKFGRTTATRPYVRAVLDGSAGDTWVVFVTIVPTAEAEFRP